MIAKACAPFDKPALRDLLAKVKQENEQTIAPGVIDEVTAQGFDIAAKEKAAALSILYSRPYAQRLTETMLKELETKLRDNHAAWTEDNLWNAFAAAHPDKVKGRTQAERFEQWSDQRRADFQVRSTPPTPSAPNPEADSANTLSGSSSFSTLPPAADSEVRAPFNPEQLTWLHSIRDHIATSLSIEPEDFEYAPFSQQGGLEKAYQLFGDQLPTLLEELNEALAA